MERLVVDASVAIAWVHPGQATAETDALLDQVAKGLTVIVPALWPLEVANALLSLERRKMLTARDRKIALEALQSLAFTVDHEMTAMAFTELSKLATDHTLSVYDAAYLELSIRVGAALACKDGALREAAKRRRVKVLP